MKVAALLKFSTLDYPGKLSAVLFFQGCPLRCKYCHNPDFRTVNSVNLLNNDEIFSFLDKRKEVLDAVVLSGGEPLMQTDLLEIARRIKGFGYEVGMHTSGIFYESFADILDTIDWVGFDFKTKFSDYESITNVINSGDASKKSLEYLIQNHNNFEIRTTYDPRSMTEQNLVEMAEYLFQNGVTKWTIQECVLRTRAAIEKLELPNSETLKKISSLINVEIRQQ